MKPKTKEQCIGVRYAKPHDGLTDLYKDKECTQFWVRDPWMQYKKSMPRIFNGAWFWIEIVKL